MVPKIRQSFYYVSSIVTGVIGLLLLFNGIGAGAADNITDIVAAIGSFLGSGSTALAGKKVSEQRKDGTFDTLDPTDAVVNGINAVIEAQRQAEAQVERVKDAVTNVVKDVPVLGPLAREALDRLT